MAGFLGRLFPALFSNPEEEAFQRKMRINATLRRFEKGVKRQDGFIKQLLLQAASAKRTGDAVNYARARKALSHTFSWRNRMQRMLNSLQIFSTMSSQKEACKEFSRAVEDITTSLKDAFSVTDAMKVQRNVELGMQQMRTTDELMDQILDSFDASFDEMTASTQNEGSAKDPELDSMIEQMIADKDNLTEDKISQMLNAKAI